MRSLGIRMPLLAASVWMGWSLSAWAMDLRYGETVYLLPTTTTVSVPTAYVATSSVVTSSYLIPSALVVPGYYPTAYFADEVVLAPTTTYVETRYRRGLLGRLFGRDRLVERSMIASYPAYVPTVFSWPAYYPTTYSVARDYTPTVFDYRVAYETAYVTSPAYRCEEVVSSWSVPVREAPSLKVPGTSTNPGSKRVESNATGESISPSDSSVYPPGAYTAIPNSRSAEETAKAKSMSPAAKGSESESPPPPPVVRKETNTDQPQEKAISKDKAESKDKEAATPKAAGSPATKPIPPKVPTDDKSDLPVESAPSGANKPGETRYEVKKPVNPTLSAIPGERRNVLFGKVESSADGQPEEEVRVIVTSRSNRAIRHEGMSNAYGRFAIKLAEGDWTVNVTMPSGRVYPVSQITVTGGRIIDEREGREVPSLIITR